MRSLDWQLHVYGNAPEALRRTARDLTLPLHILPWSKDARLADFVRDAAYLVRPDVYVALARASSGLLQTLFSTLELRTGGIPPARQTDA